MPKASGWWDITSFCCQSLWDSSHMAKIVSDKVKFFCEQQETQKLPSWTGQIKLGHIDNWKVRERDGRRREGGLGSQHGIFSKNILTECPHSI